MEGFPPEAGAIAADVTPSSSPPDVMTNLAFDPTAADRRESVTSKSTSEGDPEKSQTCRICRSEGTPDEPLFYPCKCSGSIKFVHQDCLMEWLSHSQKKHCELCKTPFRFTKLYDANMPQKLPWAVFLRRACWHVVRVIGKGCRSLLVGLVWLVTIPFAVRWAWRWFFWMADVVWARADVLDQIWKSAYFVHESDEGQSAPSWLSDGIWGALKKVDPTRKISLNVTSSEGNNILSWMSSHSSNMSTSFKHSHSNSSMLSSWTYVSSMTSSPSANRVILDVFEGQLITCVVITGFILVFLIREWVVQQQPLVNLENPQNIQPQNIQPEPGEIGEEELELGVNGFGIHHLNILVELHRQDTIPEGFRETVERVPYLGWDILAEMIDEALETLRSDQDPGRKQFAARAAVVAKQIRAAGGRDAVEPNDFREKILGKLANCSEEELAAWGFALVSELRTIASPDQPTHEDIHAQIARIEFLLAQREGAQDDGLMRRGSHASALPDLAAEGATISNISAETSSTTEAHSAGALDKAPRARRRSNAWRFHDMPITNAGVDARANIKQSSSRGTRNMSEFKIEERMLNEDLLKQQLEGEIAKEFEEKSNGNISSDANIDPAPPIVERRSTNEDNPFHPEGRMPERRNSENFGTRVASVFREEFGLDETNELEGLRRESRDFNATPVHRDSEDVPSLPSQSDNEQLGYLQVIANWFWGDIQVQDAQEQPVPPNEERQHVDETEQVHEAPFVPIPNGEPAPVAAVPGPAPVEPYRNAIDPVVIAAAQEAGANPEAFDDAVDEDIEGVLELIGLQGPLAGLFQASAFATVLVACTVLCAIVLPYFVGKLALNFIGSPVYFAVKLPLQFASFVADLVVDLALLMASAWVMLSAYITRSVLALASTFYPGRIKFDDSIVLAMNYFGETAANSIVRMKDLFAFEQSSDYSWSYAFLFSSMHAHASLRSLQNEVDAVLAYAGAAVTWTVEMMSSGSPSEVFWEILHTLSRTPPLLDNPSVFIASCRQHSRAVHQFFIDVSTGSLTISTPKVPMDPEHVYWTSSERALTIIAGYAALSTLAAIYVAADTPITRSEAGRKIEKMIQDTLRQAGGVFKVILIISIEMLVFPLYCGMLLDLAFLPLFQDASMASRWAFAGERPYTFCFAHWFVGTCYMFHFALFVGMCRKILRRGVLWFIRDPDDPTFHPVRDVLERNVATQLRKIAFSGLVYGALVILCLGGVIWTIGQVADGIFPIYWVTTEPVLEFPLDLLLYNFATPLVIRVLKPSDGVHALYAWWLRRCARMLRLSHFLFDDRRKDEEGRLLDRTWTDFFLMRGSDRLGASTDDDSASGSSANTPVRFERNGRYVLTPCSDQYRPPKAGEAFLFADENDVYIADKSGKKNDHFSKVYTPPLFKLRMSLFMVCLWIFSAFLGLCSTILPLILGRWVFTSTLPAEVRVNDIYAYSVGGYLLGGALYAAIKGPAAAAYLKQRATTVDFKAWIEPLARFTLKSLRCLYVYGFIGVGLPVIFGLFLQFYLILPLHTYAASVAATTATADLSQSNVTDTIISATNHTSSHSFTKSPNTTLAEHTIHILQDYALTLLYVRIGSRLVMATPTSRAAEALRRITADGYSNPDARLATRVFVLPATIFATFLLLFPLSIAKLLVLTLRTFGPNTAGFDLLQTKIYRYSYPVAASFVAVALGMVELARATSRWRTRIRDEVYLVGERLHNFGEKRPPVGSKSVVRREK